MTRLSLLAAFLPVSFLASIAQAQTALPAPSLQVVEVTLENPRTPQSKSYLDLDTGKTFNYGDSNPSDFAASRQWMRQSGADIMCETRPPSEGFAAYNLILVPAKTAFADTNDYDTVMRQLRDAPAPDAFAMVNVVNSLPKTYLFKTTEGAIGVLEATEVTTDPSGLKLRYKVLPKPVIPEVIARGRAGGGRRGGGAGNPAAGPVAQQGQNQVAQQQQQFIQQQLQALQQQLGGLNQVGPAGPLPPINGAPVNPPVAARGRGGRANAPLGPGGIPQSAADRSMASTVSRLVQTQQQRLQELTQTYGPNHPATLDAQRRLDLMQRLADPQQQPTNPLEELLRQRFELQQRLATVEASIAAQTQTAAQLREQMKRVQASVDKLEADQKAQARGPTTGPATAPVAP